MSCRTWMPLLIEYFSTIKDIESKIEDIRLEICQNPSFNPEQLFHSIDTNDKNFITLNDIKLYLNNHNLPFEEQCLRRFIHNFSKEENFQINYNDFLGLIISKTNSSFNINNSKYSNENTEKVDHSIETSFLKLIQLELNLIKTLNQITQQLKNSKDFMIYEAFIAIVKFDKYINVENLSKFLMDFDINLNNQDIQNLMFRLDLDGDGKISYKEFVDIFYHYKVDYSFSDTQITKENQNTYSINDINKSYSNTPNFNYNSSSSKNILLEDIINPEDNNYNSLKHSSLKHSNLKSYNSMKYNNNNYDTNPKIPLNNNISQDFHSYRVNNFKSKNYNNSKLSYPSISLKRNNSSTRFDDCNNNNKNRFSSVDKSINNLYNLNIPSYNNSMMKKRNMNSSNPKDNINLNYNNQVSLKKNNSMIINSKPNYSSSIGDNLSKDYINKLRTFNNSMTLQKNNKLKNLNRNTNLTENCGKMFFTKNTRYSPNRSQVMISEIVKLPYPNKFKNN